MFSDGLSENDPCWALKLCLCFSTVIAAGPDGAFPSTRSMLYIGVGGRAGLGLSVFIFSLLHQLLSMGLCLAMFSISTDLEYYLYCKLSNQH